MNHALRLSVLAACLVGVVGAGDAVAKDGKRSRAVEFLKAHVMGRTVRADETIERAEGGKSETVVSDACTYNNLTETSDGFQFDLTQVVGRTTYAVGEDGKRVGPGRRTDLAAVFHYAVIERRSTGRLTGFDRVVSCTDPAAYTVDQVYAVRVDPLESKGDVHLAITESTIEYEDVEIDGAHRPGAYEYSERLVVRGGKLHKEEVLSTYRVDPETLKRTPYGAPVEKEWKEGGP